VTELFTHRIELITSRLAINGAYDLAIYRRASDALNGEPRRYIPLREAAVATIEQPAQAQRVPLLFVDRLEAILVAAIAEASPPEDYPRDEQLRGVEQIATMIFTNAFVVRATVYKRPDMSLADWLDRQTDDFLPLSNVTVLPFGGGFAPFTRAFAAIAREQIVALYQC
jgi:hypothetical protein